MSRAGGASPMAGRLPQLDVLRGIAVLLVLVHHSPTSLGARLRAGWTGVDLFFVLSGFLVSGLLFKEHRRSGAIRPARFYLRRGFKIYPNFYSMLGLTSLLQIMVGLPPQPGAVAHEAIFVQNYLAGVWGHTWSLAVEEHFYLMLPPLLILLLRWKAFGRAPVRSAALLCAAVGIGLLVLRSALVRGGAGAPDVLFKTHTRMDALAFGVFLSVVWHFAPERVSAVRRLRWWLLALGALMTVPAYVLPYEDPFMLSFGLTFLYLGYGAVLAAVLTMERSPAGPLERPLAMIGFYSYSIYLWHFPVYFALRWMGWNAVTRWSYFVASPAVGVIAAKLVELPALRLREAWFPAEPSVRKAT